FFNVTTPQAFSLGVLPSQMIKINKYYNALSCQELFDLFNNQFGDCCFWEKFGAFYASIVEKESNLVRVMLKSCSLVPYRIKYDHVNVFRLQLALGIGYLIVGF